MKKKICMFLSIMLFLLPFVHFKSDTSASELTSNTCLTTGESFERVNIDSSYYRDGNLIEEFEDGVIVEYDKNGDIYVRDPNNVMNANINDLPIIENPNSKDIGTVIVIGLAIYNAVGACSNISYVTGYDICRIALQYLSSPKPNTTYEVHAFREPYHIPGCYPSSSPQCIQYNVTYRFVIMN